jgi:CRP-like cAMP-binding protein
MQLTQKIFEICSRMPFYNVLKQYIDENDKKDAMLNVFKRVTLEHVKKGKLVFRENDADCSKAYVIVKGRIGVIRKDTMKLEKKKEHKQLDFPESPTNTQDSKSGAKLIATRLLQLSLMPRKTQSSPQYAASQTKHLTEFNDSSIEHSADDDPIFCEEIYQDIDMEVRKEIPQYGRLIAKLGYGEIFGQIALQRNEPRNASIMALEDISLMVIHKQEFDYIKVYYSYEFNERKSFISSAIPQIDTLKDIKTLTRFLQYFELVTFSRVTESNKDTVITKENMEGKTIYLLKEGECSVEKRMRIETRRDEPREKNINLCLIQQGAVIGEECIGAESKYHYTVVVKSNKAVCFILRKQAAVLELYSLDIYNYLLKKYRHKK